VFLRVELGEEGVEGPDLELTGDRTGSLRM
jgi:hypothetical protein